MKYEENCFIVFGKEIKGLLEFLLKVNMDICIRVFMLDVEKVRLLNLLNLVVIVVYEVLR